MTYGIWLSYNNKEIELQLPVNPESIEISDALNSKTYDIVGLGEINVIKGTTLTEISFSSFFPATGIRNYMISNNVGNEIINKVIDPFVTTANLLEPFDYVENIKKWMRTKRPIRFIFTGGNYEINMAASIESFDWKEVAGSGGDIEYKIDLKQYLFYSPRKLIPILKKGTAIASMVDNGKERANEKQTPRTYTLRSGDNLWKVAKLQLGDGARWKEIQTLNKIPDSKLKTLQIGMVVKLPTTKGATANA